MGRTWVRSRGGSGTSLAVFHRKFGSLHYSLQIGNAFSSPRIISLIANKLISDLYHFCSIIIPKYLCFESFFYIFWWSLLRSYSRNPCRELSWGCTSKCFWLMPFYLSDSFTNLWRDIRLRVLYYTGEKGELGLVWALLAYSDHLVELLQSQVLGLYS